MGGGVGLHDPLGSAGSEYAGLHTHNTGCLLSVNVPCSPSSDMNPKDPSLALHIPAGRPGKLVITGMGKLRWEAPGSGKMAW